MTPARAQLQRMAREQRHVAWCHAKRLPGRTSDVAGAFAERHPYWALAMAAGWFLRPRRPRRTSTWKPLTAVVTALSAQVLAQVPRILGLVGSARRFRGTGTEDAVSGQEGTTPGTTKPSLVPPSSECC
jgi:hypothetical protein